GDRRQLEWGKEQVELDQRTPADEGQRPAGALRQALERDHQIGRHHDLERRRSEIENRSVDIEQDGARWERGGVDVQLSSLPIAAAMTAVNAAGRPQRASTAQKRYGGRPSDPTLTC